MIHTKVVDLEPYSPYFWMWKFYTHHATTSNNYYDSHLCTLKLTQALYTYFKSEEFLVLKETTIKRILFKNSFTYILNFSTVFPHIQRNWVVKNLFMTFKNYWKSCYFIIWLYYHLIQYNTNTIFVTFINVIIFFYSFKQK